MAAAQDFGLQQLTFPDPSHCVIDVVFIHGLDGHRSRTWTSPLSGDVWPLWLRDDVPGARVWTYGYNSSNVWQLGRARCTWCGSVAGTGSCTRRKDREWSMSSKLPAYSLYGSLTGLYLGNMTWLSLCLRLWFTFSSLFHFILGCVSLLDHAF